MHRLRECHRFPPVIDKDSTELLNRHAPARNREGLGATCPVACSAPMGACGLSVNLPAAMPGRDVLRPSLHEFLAPERQDQGLRECLTGEPETAPPGGGPGSVVENERPNGLSCDEIARLIGNAIFVENHRPEPEGPDSRALVKGLLVVYSAGSVEARAIVFRRRSLGKEGGRSD